MYKSIKAIHASGESVESHIKYIMYLLSNSASSLSKAAGGYPKVRKYLRRVSDDFQLIAMSDLAAGDCIEVVKGTDPELIPSILKFIDESVTSGVDDIARAVVIKLVQLNVYSSKEWVNDAEG